MAGIEKRNGKPIGVMMNLAEIVYAYNTLKKEPIPPGMTYEAAAAALVLEFGCTAVCTAGNEMRVAKYVAGEYDFQVANKAKGISQ